MKLIKTTDDQGVMYSLSGDNSPENYVLSLKNCQAIENGYDLEELIKNDYIKHSVKDDKLSLDEQIQRSGGFNVGYKEGFQKAVKILGNKKFSEEDIDNFRKFQIQEQNFSKSCLDVWLQSLQQTEWDCIIEMECCGNYSPPCNINCEYGGKPKLDADGNLILKRKQHEL